MHRYFPKSRSLRGGLVPSPATTVRVMKALLRKRRFQLVLDALDPIEHKIRETYREYFFWKKELRRRNIIFNPLSRDEIDKLEKSLY